MPGLDRTGPMGMGVMSGRGLGRCAGTPLDKDTSRFYGRGRRARCGERFGAIRGGGGGGRGLGFLPRQWFDASRLGAAERQRFTDEALSQRRAALLAELARMDALIAKAQTEEQNNQ